MIRHIPPLSTSLLLVSVAAGTQDGVSQERWTPEVQLRFKTITETALSPDGSRVAFTVREARHGSGRARFVTRVWIASTDGSGSRPLTSTEHSSSAPSFSSDGRRVAFLSGRSGDNQVWVLRLDGGSPSRITDAPGGVTRFAWSPTDGRLAYVAPDPDSPSDPKGSIGASGPLSLEGRDAVNHHVFVLDVDDLTPGYPEAVQVTWGGYHVTDLDWAPSGTRIALAIGRGPDPDEAFRFSDLIVANLAGRGVRRRLPLTQMGGTETAPRWSPAGAWIAFTGSGDRPEPVGLGDVWVLPVDGGDPRRLASTDERSGSSALGWSKGGDAVLIAEPFGTSVRLVAVPVDGSEPFPVTTTEGHRQAFAVASAANLVAYSLETPERPPEVYVLDLESGREVVVSAVNAGVPMPPPAPTEVLRWRAPDGLDIEGLLTVPSGGVNSRFPLALVLHGGPAASATRTFTGGPDLYMVQSLVTQGYTVLRPNPRGSVGYGPGFRYAAVGDWGGAAVDDVLSGVDEVVRLGLAHPDSLMVMGWGYGGYLAASLAAATDRVRAVSVGAPLADLGALALTTDITTYLSAHMGAEVWEDPGAYLRASLLPRLADIDAPVQIIHGSADERIPSSQGFAVHAALRRRGVESELYLFDGASPSSRPDVLAAVQMSLHRWLDERLRPVPPEPPVLRPPRQPRRASFIRSEYEPYGEPGDGVIEGVAYLVMPDGSLRFCFRELVFMNPVTTLSTEWYERNVLDREELEPIPPTGYHWITRADERGRFRFVDLPPGDYYLGCRAVPEEGFAHGRVRLEEGGRAYVELTRHVPAGGDDPLRQEPSGPAEWGQLAGTWRCRVRTPDAQGIVSEAESIWTWEYILGGTGVRDVYVGLDDAGAPRFRGTAIRIYNPETSEWEISWADDATSGVRTYRATYGDGRIEMRKTDEDPGWRTVFYDITPTTFDWMTEPSGGRMRCAREPGTP